MRYLLQLSRWIDATNTAIGKAMGWVVIGLVALGVINVLGRYIGAQLGVQLSSNALLEAQTQAFNLIFLLAAAWLLLRNEQIRVDILHAQLSPQLRCWIDLIGHLFLLIPFCVLVLWTGSDYVQRAWIRLEVSPNPGGLPLYPIKTVILVAFTLLLIQAISESIKRIEELRRMANHAHDPRNDAERP